MRVSLAQRRFATIAAALAALALLYACVVALGPASAADREAKPCPPRRFVDATYLRRGDLRMYSYDGFVWICNRKTRRNNRLPHARNPGAAGRFRFALVGSRLAYWAEDEGGVGELPLAFIYVYDLRTRRVINLHRSSPPCQEPLDPRKQCGSGASIMIGKLLLDRSGWTVWSLCGSSAEPCQPAGGRMVAILAASPGSTEPTLLDEGDDVRAGSLRFGDDGRVTWYGHGQRQYFEIPTR